MNYGFDWFYVEKSLPQLLDGLVLTIKLTVWANVIGLTLGFIIALGMLSGRRIFTVPLTIFIEFFRCTPALVQLIWFYFCLPMLLNVWWSGELTGTLALGFNLAAFNAEAYRASIQAIPSAHRDASVALGLNSWQRILYVVFPQSALMAAPVLMTNAIGIFQQSALLALISVEELMYQGKSISTQYFRPIETFTAVAIIYFMVSFPFSQIVSVIEKKTQRLLAN